MQTKRTNLYFLLILIGTILFTYPSKAQCLINQNFATYTPTTSLIGSCRGTVDVHLNGGSHFGINEFSLDGNNYLGLHPTLGGDATSAYEYVSFVTSTPMVIGTTYSGSFHQAVGMLHGLATMGLWVAENLGNVPGYFKIYAGNSHCDTAELIYSSTLLPNESAGWTIENFTFTATAAYTHITVVPLAPSPGNLTPYMLFDHFTICQITPMPVELLLFEADWADKNKTNARIFWQTASEINNDYFFLERSVDGINWSEIAQIDGAGNSNSVLNYDYYDKDIDQLPSTIFYYRLKQIDFDGKVSLSDIDVITRNEITVMNFWPNPVTEDLNLSIYSPDEQKVKIEIINILGQSVFTRYPVLSEGYQQIKLPLENLNAGTYFIKCITEKDFHEISETFIIN